MAYKKRGFIAAAAFSALCASGALAQTSMTYAYSENPSSTVAAEAFERMVENQSNGDIQVNTIIHGALGTDRAVVDQLMLGELEMYVPGVHGLSAVAPNFQFFDAPYVFSNRREFYALMEDDEFVGYLNDYLQNASNGRIMFMGAAENSVRNLYTASGPIETPEDLGPVKLRVSPGPLNISVWQELGVGSVVGLSGSERNQALQSGIIDGVEGSLSGAMGNGHLDILDHISMTGHSYSYMAYLLNAEFFEGLSAEHQQIVRNAIDLAITIQNGAAITQEQEALQQARADGNTVTTPSASQLQQWRDIAYPVGQEFISEQLDQEFVDRAEQALEGVRSRLGS